jgi:hypothetical protein
MAFAASCQISGRDFPVIQDRIVSIGLLILVSLLSVPAVAQDRQASCADPEFDWSGTVPDINLRHILCGQYNRSGKPVGAHSMLIIKTSADVKSVSAPIVTVDGLTSRTVTFSQGEVREGKSFYPDACTLKQIVTSVQYAASEAKPVGNWFRGPSAPAVRPAGSPQYCLTSGQLPFTIQFAWLDREAKTRINTAFPILPAS